MKKRKAKKIEENQEIIAKAVDRVKRLKAEAEAQFIVDGRNIDINQLIDPSVDSTEAASVSREESPQAIGPNHEVSVPLRLTTLFFFG
jgi:hypothetical protein